MSTEHEPEETTTAAAGADDAPAPAEGAASDESLPEGAVAVEDAPEVDPLEGKSDEEIRELAAQAAEYLALAQRTRADFDNYRKRTQRDIAAAKRRGGVDLARELLPAIDNAERALEHETSVVFDAGDDGEHARRILDALKVMHGSSSRRSGAAASSGSIRSASRSTRTVTRRWPSAPPRATRTPASAVRSSSPATRPARRSSVRHG